MQKDNYIKFIFPVFIIVLWLTATPAKQARAAIKQGANMSLFNKVTKTFQWGDKTVVMKTGEIDLEHTTHYRIEAVFNLVFRFRIGYLVSSTSINAHTAASTSSVRAITSS